jgi:parallel beta-helix repeat protein
MKRKIVGIFVCVILTLTAFSLSVSSYETLENTIYVDDDAPSEWYDATHVKTIQEGINVALNGGSMFVYSGIYNENIIVNKTLVIEGEDKKSTIIDGQRNGEFVIKVNANMVDICGFTIQNGSRGIAYESGIKIENSDYCSVMDCILVNNGWAAEIRNSEHCKFNNNFVYDNDGGGVHLPFAPCTTIKDCKFSGNAKTGIMAWGGKNLIIESNEFIDCGLVMHNGPPSENVNQNTIVENTVNGKPLVYLENEKGKIIKESGQVILFHCKGILVKNLELSNTAVGITVYGSSLIRIVANTINDNSEGISVVKSMGIAIVNNNIINNRYTGLGVYSSGLCQISSNKVSGNNYGLYLYGSIFNLPYFNIIQDNQKYDILIDSPFLPPIQL